MNIDRFLGEKSRSRSISEGDVLAHQQKVRIPGQGLNRQKSQLEHHVVECRFTGFGRF